MSNSTLPLAGARVLLPARLDSTLRAALEAAGADVDEVTLLERRPCPGTDLEALAERLRAGEVNWLVIASAYTVKALELLGHPLGELASPHAGLAAVGPTSAAAVRRAVGRVDLAPTDGTGGAALAAVFPDGPGTVVIPGPAEPSPELPTLLRARGWEVESPVVYETLPAGDVGTGVSRAWHNGEYLALVATSSSVARAAAALLGTAGHVVAVGEASARAAEQARFATVTRARTAVAPDVVQALTRLVN